MNDSPFKMVFNCGTLNTKYVVEQKSDTFFSISRVYFNDVKFICHKENRRQACKLATILAQTYYEAYCDGSY